MPWASELMPTARAWFRNDGHAGGARLEHVLLGSRRTALFQDQQQRRSRTSKDDVMLDMHSK
jgi:hypothetical protein